MPLMVTNVHVTSVKSTEISLAWDPPSGPFSEIEMYEVSYTRVISTAVLAHRSIYNTLFMRVKPNLHYQIFGNYLPRMLKDRTKWVPVLVVQSTCTNPTQVYGYGRRLRLLKKKLRIMSCYSGCFLWILFL